MQVFVGTSGWFYDWNPERSLDWFVQNSGLNALELNASFYRFPFPNQVKSWAKKGNSLRWAVKVSKLITHQHLFNPNAYEVWNSFYQLFAPLDSLIDFYLFQLPPRLDITARPKLTAFIKKTALGRRFALECRNKTWFNPETVNWAEKLGITLVTVDAPDYPGTVFNTSGSIYLRLHGRTEWYRYCYSRKELKTIAVVISQMKPAAVYAFFNNDQDMLSNARTMFEILKTDAGN